MLATFLTLASRQAYKAFQFTVSASNTLFYPTTSRLDSDRTGLEKTSLTSSPGFHPVNYDQFRNTLEQSAGHKILNKGRKTYVYDQDNHVLGILMNASMDAFGRISPAQYFVSRFA